MADPTAPETILSVAVNPRAGADAPPRPGEDRLWAWLEEAAQLSARARREQAKFHQFDEWLRLYHGQHWPDAMPSFRPPVVVNELRTLILAEASDLLEAGFRAYVTRDPSLKERDVDAERALRAVWVNQQFDLKLLDAILWALVAGTGFIRVGWDPDAAEGLGDVVVESLDPRTVLPDPDATDDLTWQWVIVESVVDLNELRRRFPLTGWRVLPDTPSAGTTSIGGEAHRTASGLPYVGPLSAEESLLPGGGGHGKYRVRVLDMLVWDPVYERVVVEQVGPGGEPLRDESGQPLFQEDIRLKYPTGRRIVGANGVILYDGPNPLPTRRWPPDFGIVRITLEPTLDRFWGQGFVQQVGQLQLAADKLASAVIENAIRLNNGMIVVRGATGVDWESFFGMPGQILQLNRDSDVQIVYPNPMPPDMVRAPWTMLDLQRRILGFPDPRSGVGGRGNVSPELTETEIAQSQGTTRLRGRMLYHAVRRLVEMLLARMLYGYTTERVIPAVDGEAFRPVIWRPAERPESFRVYLDPASFQVLSKSMLRRLAVALYRLGAIDRRALLEAVGWPNWEETARRLDEAERLAAEAKLTAKRRRSS